MPELKLDIGCGAWPREGYIGVDKLPDGTVTHGGYLVRSEIQCDLDKEPLPYQDSIVKAIYSSHFLEHIQNVSKVLDEFHRVCENGALVEIIVPIWEYFSVDHLQLFYPGWSQRMFKPEKWAVTKVLTIEKWVDTSAGVGYYIFEQQLQIYVKK